MPHPPPPPECREFFLQVLSVELSSFSRHRRWRRLRLPTNDRAEVVRLFLANTNPRALDRLARRKSGRYIIAITVAHAIATTGERIAGPAEFYQLSLTSLLSHNSLTHDGP